MARKHQKGVKNQEWCFQSATISARPSYMKDYAVPNNKLDGLSLPKSTLLLLLFWGHTLKKVLPQTEEGKKKSSQFAFAYNTSFHRAIQDTPFFLAHGRDLHYPLHVVDPIDLDQALADSAKHRTSFPPIFHKAHKLPITLQSSAVPPPTSDEDAANIVPIGIVVWLCTPQVSTPRPLAFAQSPSSKRPVTDIRSITHVSRLKLLYSRTGPDDPPSSISEIDLASAPLSAPGDSYL